MNEMFSQGGKGSTGILTNKQAIARKFGVKQNEVVYFSVGVDLGGYKVIYDKTTQRAYSLPVLPVGTTAVSLNAQAVLVHSAGTVDLGELAATRREFVNLSDTFATGLVVNTRNELLFHNGIGYSYLGSLPVTITSGTNPIGNADWKSQTDPNLREDLSSPDLNKGASLVTFHYLGDTVESTLCNIQSVPFEHFGGGTSKTGEENTAALKAAISSPFKHIWFNNGPYTFSGDTTFTGINGKIFESNTNAAFVFSGLFFNIKSPVDTEFRGITFSAPPTNTVLNSVMLSNFTNIKFTKCKFLGFGGDTTNTAGSAALILYAGDSETAQYAAGSSAGAILDGCYFDGLRDRLCNFAVRVYTEFTVPTASIATNSNNKIINCEFVGYNWNAVEIAGPSTHSNIVSNCSATNPGLCPFDLDKGTHDNIVENITIRNLKGDLGVSGFTRASAVNIQGATADTYFAYNNTVRNVTCVTTKDNIDAYNATGFGSGFAAVSLAYCYNNFVDNVTMTCNGGVPTKPSNGTMAFCHLTFESISGCTVNRVSTVNASHGILMTSFKSQSMSALNEPNHFSTFRNSGANLEGEIFYGYATAAGSPLKIILKDIDLTTSGTQSNLTYNGHKYAIVYRTAGSSVNYLRVEESRIGLATDSSLWFAMCTGPQIGLREVQIHDGDGSANINSRFMESNGLALITNIAIDNVYGDLERKPIQIQTALAGLTGGTFKLVGGISDSGLPQSRPVTLFANSATTFPSAAQFDTNIILRRTSATTGQAWGWISTGTAWAALGSLT